MYGKKHSAESLQKMSMSKKGSIITEHTKALLSRIMSGRKLSPQTRQKISIITTNQWKDPDQRRRKLKGLEKAAWKGSKLEHKVASILEELFIPYERHRGLSFCIPDFYLPANQGFIEVDGAYWHRTEKQIRKDLRNTKWIQGMGFAILRIPEIEVNEGWARQSILNFINK
ncbi:NUMOD3 domain-containing DNA-binding protein [Paenibacillus sp. GP183]|uniref:NUMOD3 domain-containing DNA-binding protein n=1 Tax=Paenibacillus sp. GP183 TaxID=1882751 RepID=UPI000899AF51|nr:NUMOD3 domain-containing DNA-binding protein [Paenibacillus sp. GP183]SEC18423.1 NUMOD3 motif-containing protein [Paenibacillus sp. GP183]